MMLIPELIMMSEVKSGEYQGLGYSGYIVHCFLKKITFI